MAPPFRARVRRSKVDTVRDPSGRSTVQTITAVLATTVSIGVALSGAAGGPPAETRQTVEAPTFVVDPTWPTLPENWVLGEVSAVAVDSRDHVWVLHRPHSVAPEQASAGEVPAAVLELDENGILVQAWGGPAPGYEWPDTEHGIHVDASGHVWISGNNPLGRNPPSQKSDDQLLKFTTAGDFVLQIGRRDQSGGNTDTDNFRQPADMWVHPHTNELFVADGYGNRRVIVVDANTGVFKRQWGAFGNPPRDPSTRARNIDDVLGTPADAEEDLKQFGLVHGLIVSNDGLVYVADRSNKRVQVFAIDGTFRTQTFVGPETPGAAGTAASLGLSPDPEQRFLYVADLTNAQVVILDRGTLERLGTFGERGNAPGQFRMAVHDIAVDSVGNIYTADLGPRAQKFALTRSPATPGR